VILRVVAPNPGPMTLDGTNTYLFSHAGEVAVIDPGPADLHDHLDAILAAAQPNGRITSVLVTHRHLDHLPAALPLCARTGAVLGGHADLPGVQRPIADGASAFGPLIARATPGHTRDSLCYFDASDGDLFTGDLVLGRGTAVLDDAPGALADYIDSLSILLRLRPRTIYPGHGPVVDDAEAKLREYIAHRQQRQQQVLSALRGGPRTIDQLVAAIYLDLAPNLQPMAARNVRACLEKLAAEGHVASTGTVWNLTR
jgi:glyoxylase-like metal-dependent hydrolase (beta-lactamase superfamily II)